MKVSVGVVCLFALVAVGHAQQLETNPKTPDRTPPQADLVAPAKAQPTEPGAANPATPSASTLVQRVPPVSSSAMDRLFFPSNFARGYVDFDMTPPHNEVDLGLCQNFPGAPSFNPNCRAYARYVFSGYMEFQPIGRGPLRRLFMITEPKFFAGQNLPQQHYGYSLAPILFEWGLGAAIAITDRAEVRVMTHKNHLMGRYAGPNSVVSLSPDGPYGMHTSVGVRYYFGGYGRMMNGPR